MTDRATLVATLTESPDEAGRALAALAGVAEVLELRADLVGDLDPDWLRSHFPGRLLYTLRSRAEGGQFEGSRDKRRRRLIEASRGFDLVDLEAERDLAEEVLAAIASERRLLSWHGPACDAAALAERHQGLRETPAALYKLVPEASDALEALEPLRFLEQLRPADTVAFASGAAGLWTRPIAPRLGAAWVYGSASPRPGAPGQPTLARLAADYGLPRLPRLATLCGLVGRPVAHSYSPRLHNAGYRLHGLPWLYLPFDVGSFGDFWLDGVESGALESVTGAQLRGFSITTPHKEAALAISCAASPIASLSGGANTLVLDRQGWAADSTDAIGVAGSLAAYRRPPAGRSIVVLGTGGAGRAVAAGLARAGARVAIASRERVRGQRVAEELGVAFVPSGEVRAERFDAWVNATPLGRLLDDPLPLDLAGARPGSVAVDLVYGEGETPWLAQARSLGHLAIDGREVLVQQAAPQFERLTGRPLPLELARELVGLEAPR